MGFINDLTTEFSYNYLSNVTKCVYQSTNAFFDWKAYWDIDFKLEIYLPKLIGLCLCLYSFECE